MWFQSTHSLRSATQQQTVANSSVYVSIHALLAECDPAAVDFFKYFTVSIHALLAECDSVVIAAFPVAFRVSIHALLAECDRSARRAGNSLQVSIHALLAECDEPSLPSWSTTVCFNPRTPCGVRRNYGMAGQLFTCFNPRTPCGVRLLVMMFLIPSMRVSIHALLAECDCARPYTLLLNKANHTLRQPP